MIHTVVGTGALIGMYRCSYVRPSVCLSVCQLGMPVICKYVMVYIAKTCKLHIFSHVVAFSKGNYVAYAKIRIYDTTYFRICSRIFQHFPYPSLFKTVKYFSWWQMIYQYFQLNIEETEVETAQNRPIKH